MGPSIMRQSVPSSDRAIPMLHEYIGKIFYEQFKSILKHPEMCDSLGLAQRNLPTQHENKIGGLLGHKLMKRRLD